MAGINLQIVPRLILQIDGPSGVRQASTDYVSVRILQICVRPDSTDYVFFQILHIDGPSGVRMNSTDYVSVQILQIDGPSGVRPNSTDYVSVQILQVVSPSGLNKLCVRAADCVSVRTPKFTSPSVFYR